MNKRTSENSQPQKEVKELKKEPEAYRNRHTAGQVAPSIGSTSTLTRGGNMTSTPPSDGRKKLYAEALCGKNGMRHKLTVKTKDNKPIDIAKKILKSSTDPNRYENWNKDL